MTRQVVNVGFVIDVVYFDFESFLLLEVEVDCNLLDKLRVQGVHDHFCLSKFLPDLSHLFVQDTEWVTFRKGVHVC